MTKQGMLNHVDHTLLKATSSWQQIKALCDEGVKYQTASVCIPPCYVAAVKAAYGDKLKICTVIGFPLGYNTPQIKEAETKQAIADGADEVDMVINICDVKNGEFDKVKAEVALLRKASEGKILKVIVETCYLTKEEKIKLCEIVTQAGADYIKTSTGFGSGGAAIEDIRLFKEHLGPKVKMKASGGIQTLEDMEAFLDEGCDRLGTSRGVKLLAE